MLKFNLPEERSYPSWLPYTVLTAFIGINTFLFTKEIFWFLLFPVLLMLIWVILYHTDKAILFLAAVTPLSIKKDFTDYGLSINLPTEPLMMLLMGLFFLKLIINGKYDKEFLHHPISLAIGFNLIWVLITALTSTMFEVSIKFFIARLWFIVVGYCLTFSVFKKESTVRYYFWIFLFSLSLVIVYSLRRHYINDWWQPYADFAPRPYFAGHGDYAAAISMFIPIVCLFIFKRKVYKINRFFHLGTVFLLGLLIFGVIMSFTRAAWLGIFASAAFAFIIIFRIRFHTLAAIFGILLVFGLLFQEDILMKLKDNKKVSGSSFNQHVESISNISTDASNTERINRWMSAIRMFEARPVFGWGPGTYMFQYAPFQRSYEMTVISTNTGTMGNAHSEYFGPLSESGFGGILSILSIVATSVLVGLRLVYKGRTPFIRNTAAAIILGLITYYIHGTINDYLDTDKGAIPVFTFLAILTVLDLHYNKRDKEALLRSEASE